MKQVTILLRSPQVVGGQLRRPEEGAILASEEEALALIEAEQAEEADVPEPKAEKAKKAE